VTHYLFKESKQNISNYFKTNTS